MDREQYRETYLRSEHWRSVRAAALERAANRCQVCNASKALDVHHRTYERLGEELPADLTVLCRRCHSLFHGGRRKADKPERSPRNVLHGASGPDPLKTRRSILPVHVSILRVLADGSLTMRETSYAIGLTVGKTGAHMATLRDRGYVAKAKGKAKQWKLTPAGRRAMT